MSWREIIRFLRFFLLVLISAAMTKIPIRSHDRWVSLLLQLLIDFPAERGEGREPAYGPTAAAAAVETAQGKWH